MMKIYTISLIRTDENEDIDQSYPRGYFTTLIAAEQAVLSNHLGMFNSGYYHYAVVEEVPEGFTKSKIISCFSASYNAEDDIIKVAHCDLPLPIGYFSSWSMGQLENDDE